MLDWALVYLEVEVKALLAILNLVQIYPKVLKPNLLHFHPHLLIYLFIKKRKKVINPFLSLPTLLRSNKI